MNRSGRTVLLFLWRHRTVVAGFGALWNFAFIWLGPLQLPPRSPVSPDFVRGLAIVDTVIFAVLCAVSLIYDRRKKA
jgi:hypothetical protein